MRTISIHRSTFVYLAIGSATVALLAIVPTMVDAQESPEASVSIDARATTRTEVTPLQRLRANAAENRDVRQDVRAEARTDIRILQDARMDERQDMQTDRQETRADMVEQMRSAETQDERRATLESAREARENMRVLRVESRAEFRSALGARVAQYKSAMIDTLSRTIDRMNDFLIRLESRIAKISENGGDTTAAELALRAALAATAQAAADVEAADAKIVAIIDGDAEASVKRTEIRTVITQAAQSVRTAHTALKDALEAARVAAQSVEVSTNAQFETNTAI